MTAQKKEGNKKKKGFLSKKARQNCLTSKNLCPILIICRLFRVFIPATAICTRPLWYFFLSVRSNLYASKYTSRELTQKKYYGYRLNYIGPLATGSNTNHMFFCHVYFHFVSSFCIAFLTISKIMVTKWLLQQ